MNNFKVISVDMFETLVNVDSRKYCVWRKILGESFTEQAADRYWKKANKLLFGFLYNYEFPGQKFYTSKAIFEKCFFEVFQENQINFDPKMAACLLATEHGFAALYDDTESFLKSVSQNYPVCLVSDTDQDMIAPLLARFQFNQIFTSEGLHSYKIEPSSTMFLAVIKHYGVKPQEILHIGDSYTDILGASRVGIKTCWLNRTHRKWNYKITPDYEVKSLLDIANILGIKTSSTA
jgi:HAD superfamily hydrolase (TIGR01509 family)